MLRQLPQTSATYLLASTKLLLMKPFSGDDIAIVHQTLSSAVLSAGSGLRNGCSLSA